MCKMKCSLPHTGAGKPVGGRPLHLSPEEDVVGAILDEADEIDDSLPADLWFRGPRIRFIAGCRRIQAGMLVRYA
jgi:hypothetical protein